MVAACGFQPLYVGGKSGPIATELGSIKIDRIADRMGQQLRNELLDKLTPYGQQASAKYGLKVTVSEGRSGLAVKKSEIATRANLQVNATFFLTDRASARRLFSGTSRSVASFNILSSSFSSLITEKDARDRAIREVASDIQSRLSAYFQLSPEARRQALP
ncbi:MAG: hypothetical protein HN403_00070 [Rhodospirillales bacterium]|jgi:LPS-assembly lipoprotein|nr:hypothetical protein [Rhodospirillales bacterium]